MSSWPSQCQLAELPCARVYVTVFVLYATLRYNWNERDVAFARRSRHHDHIVSAGNGRLAREAVSESVPRCSWDCSGAIGFALFGASPTGWLFVAAIPVNALWGLAAAAAPTLMTRRVFRQEQGNCKGR